MQWIISNLSKHPAYLIISLVIFPLLLLFIINLGRPTEKSIDFNIYLEKIEDCNYKLSSAVSSKGLNLVDAEKYLSDQLVNLNNIKDNLTKVSPTIQSDISTQDKIIEMLNDNICLYESSITLLRKTDNTDLLATCNDCSNYYSILLDDYTKLQAFEKSSKFPNETKEFFDLLFSYFNTYVKVSREGDIKLTQKQIYVSNIKECINSFNDISQDLKPAVDKIHEENRDLTVLLQDVKDKKSAFNQIKNKSYCITIPEEGNDCFKLLKDTISCYDLYITSLEQSIILDKTCNTKNNCTNIEANYKNSFEKYDNFLTSLKDLSTELDEFNKN